MNWFKKASVNNTHKETVTEAFCRQAKIDPNDPSQQSEETSLIFYYSDANQVVRKAVITSENAEKDEKRAIEMMSHMDERNNLRANSSLQVPSKLPIADRWGTPMQKTVPHPLMTKYDHSLDMDRWKGSGFKDGIEIA